jgi:HAD superfamily hydrolase (TIGR01509 family)
MPSSLRAIFFDAGNTLVYPRVEELAEELTRQGYPAGPEDFFAAERAGKQKLDEWLWPQIRQGEVPRTIDPYYWGEYLKALVERLGVPGPEQLRIMHHVADGFREITLWSRVLPETPPFLEKLRGQGYHLGVISNSIGTMEQQLQRLDLARHFETVIDSAVVGVEKPHPDIFRIAFQRAGVSSQDALFVGDTNATDMGGAHLAGLRGVLIDRVGAYPNAESPRITSLPELERLL